MDLLQQIGTWGNLSHAKIYLVKEEPFTQGGSPIAKLNINESVVEAIKEVIGGFAAEASDRKCVAITDLDGQDENYLLAVPLSEVASIEKAVELIRQECYVAPNVHSDICVDYLKGLKFYIIEAVFGSKQVFFMRRYSASNLITPRKYMLVCTDNTFTRIDNTNIISLDSKLDAVIVDDVIYVANDTPFSLASGYYEKERRMAGVMLDAISKHAVIAGFDELKEHCEGRISLVKKLSKIDPGNLQKITFEKVRELKSKRGVDFIVDEDKQQVTFNTTAQIRNIVDLVLDNFVTSDVTDTCYRAVNKMKEQAS